MQTQPTPDTRYVTVSPDTWSLIRGAYLSGLSARTVAGRFGVSEGAMRKRAAREGWTKRAFAARATPWPGALERPRMDSAAPSAATAGEADVPLTEDDIVAAWTSPIQIRPGDLARRALAAAAEAVRGGRGLTALRLARAASEIARLDALFEWVELDPAAEEARSAEGQLMARRFLRERALGLARDLALGRPLPPEYDEFVAPAEAAP
jgi:hypothetical protein